jgi:flavin-dependent dehydrogenase
MSVTAKYDVAIVGAGVSGSAVALKLAQNGYNVVMVERSLFDKPRIGESLSPGVQPLLENSGNWAGFLELNPLPSYGTRSLWGSPDPEEHAHLFTAYLSGWHVDRLAFDQMMASAAIKAGADMISGTRVPDVRFVKGKGFFLTIANTGTTYELFTRFLIDASGRNTVLGSRLGADRIVFDRLVGIAIQFNDAKAGDHCYTLIESVPVGWWYTAPLPGGRSTMMLMTDGDITGQHPDGLFAQWKNVLQHTTLTRNRFGEQAVIWGPKTFSAVSQRLVKMPDDERPWLSVGDASLAVDPISGSGVIRALRTAVAAVPAVAAALNGDAALIRQYEADRNDECTQYLLELGTYYDMEQRWPEHVFWKRRNTALKQYRSALSGK